MSCVADIILVTAIEDGAEREDEYPNVEKLERALQQIQQRPTMRLVKVDGYAGGDKAMQCDVFLVAVNYLNVGRFLDAFRAIRWDMPECVQLMIKNEHDDAFTIYQALGADSAQTNNGTGATK